MLTYRAVFSPQSASLTPWQADTLLGQLCWTIRYEDGLGALQDFLDQCRSGNPPVIFSNGFPGDLLPRSLIPIHHSPRQTKAEQLDEMDAAKKNKAIRWVQLDEFNAVRSGNPVGTKTNRITEISRQVMKNQINRMTGTTTGPEDEGGHLFDLEELAFFETKGAKKLPVDISVYVKLRDEEWAQKVERWLGCLAQSGYGKKKSSGYGQVELAKWSAFTGFEIPIGQPNGFVSLSNWVPAKSDPIDGYYQPLIKYGKLGEELGATRLPFKFPLYMFQAGSFFRGESPIREWYGRIVEGVAPGRDGVVQFGYAFALPVTVP